MTEKPAENVRGFFLYNPFDNRHFFRVYGEVDPATGHKSFTDYKVRAEDIEVTIHAGGLSLYESEPDDPDSVHNKLDWSSEALGKDLVAGPKITFPCKSEGCDEIVTLRTYNKPLVMSVCCKAGHRSQYKVDPLQPTQ
jgi:hypothetical protein